jgi:hypothetical protein
MELTIAEKEMIQRIACSQLGVTAGHPTSAWETTTAIWDVVKNEQDEITIATLSEKYLVIFTSGRLVQLSDAGFKAYLISLVMKEQCYERAI